VRNENTIEECAYRLPLMVATLQQIIHLRLVDGHKAIYANDINKAGNTRRIQELYIESDLLHTSEMEALKNVMIKEIRTVDREDVVDLIEERRPGTALLVPVFGALTHLIVYDLQSRQCVFLQRELTTYETGLKILHFRGLRDALETAR